MHGCVPFFRSVAACSLGPPDVEQVRQQMNAVTSFMDASQIYSSAAEVQFSLRDLAGRNGKLLTNSKFRDPNGRDFLPSVGERSGCRQSQEGERVECFHAGDSRASEGLHLAALHTLFHREHNRIAEALKGINGHWTPETIYQETRRIIAALLQVREAPSVCPGLRGHRKQQHTWTLLLHFDLDYFEIPSLAWLADPRPAGPAEVASRPAYKFLYLTPICSLLFTSWTVEKRSSVFGCLSRTRADWPKEAEVFNSEWLLLAEQT